MKTTYEAIIENGQVKLLNNVKLPEHTKVYVVVAEEKEKDKFYLRSPRLVNKQKLIDFKKEMLEE